MYESKGLYYCGVCHTAYETPVKATACEKRHDIVTLSFTPRELQSLVNFIVTEDLRMLEPTVYTKIKNALANVNRAKKGV